jgi:hypothetical protein
VIHGGFPIKGQTLYDSNAANGVAGRRRNPKKKNRLPYHAKLNTRPNIMGQGKCHHALTQHQTMPSFKEHEVIVSYALPCQVGHKATTKVPQHKDVLGRKW